MTAKKRVEWAILIIALVALLLIITACSTLPQKKIDNTPVNIQSGKISDPDPLGFTVRKANFSVPSVLFHKLITEQDLPAELSFFKNDFQTKNLTFESLKYMLGKSGYRITFYAGAPLEEVNKYYNSALGQSSFVFKRTYYVSDARAWAIEAAYYATKLIVVMSYTGPQETFVTIQTYNE